MSATPKTDLDLIVSGDHSDPFSVLGSHALDTNEGTVVRAFVPAAEQIWLIEADNPNAQHAMNKVHDAGFFELVFADRRGTFPYRFKSLNKFGDVSEFHDPYSFGPLLSDFDLHLMAEGTHYRNYEKLGSHVRTVDGIRGVHFAVWAPNAKRVSVIGEFNQWDGRRHPMRFLTGTGIWEIFIPELHEETVYKFEIKWRRFGFITHKTDPYAFYFERRPKTGAIVYDINQYVWRDDEWMEKRKGRNAFDAPISIYEVHLGSWMRAPEE